MHHLITWFRSPWKENTYFLAGILQDEVEVAPGVLIEVEGEIIDYAPDSGEEGQMQLFDVIPERITRISTPNLPSLSYARGRVDWMECTNKWTTSASAISVVEDLLCQSTPIPDVVTVE